MGPNSRRAVLAAISLAVLAGCESGRHASTGFRLPPDGDAERGKAAFVAFGCAACHEVAGGDSRMPHYAETMTVRQLTDLVAFLQSRYSVRHLNPRNLY